MAAVDFDLKFTYVLAGWEGSAHDALILANALEREDGLKVPTGNSFLGARLSFLGAGMSFLGARICFYVLKYILSC